MKKFFALFILLLSMGKIIHAQDTISLEGKMRYIFAQLNRNDISTGFLEERGFPMISLKPFNGTLTDSNKLSINTLRAGYFTLYSSCMLQTNPLLPVDSINNRIDRYFPLQDAVPVSVVLGRFNTFKPDALSNNLVSIDGDDVIHDVAGRTALPYLTNSLFAASPIIDEFATGNFSLIFKQDLFFTNSGLTVNHLYIDFDDGQGYRTTTWNSPIYPAYSTIGTKNIKIKVILSDNSSYECYSPITVKEISALLRFNPDSPNVIETFYPTGNHSGGRVFVRYSSLNGSGHIKKPLIVAEGYDPSSTAPNLGGANFTYKNFVNQISTDALPYDLNGKLDDVAGYDLVFIDYNNGTDDIVRNANLFKDVLLWVNADKALGGSSEQNVVMGVSMGGLVARYGLADLTKNNIATQTRLLITHDSPHQGANVPVGLQEVVLNIGRAEILGFNVQEILPQYAEITRLMQSPATQQLLKYRVETHVNTIGPPFFFFDYYYTTIESNTWLSNVYRPMITFTSSDPQPSYRFIATSQGSECGTALAAPGSSLLNVQGHAAAALLPFLASAKANASIEANALPNMWGGGQIAKIDMSLKIYLFGLVRVRKDVFKSIKTLNSSSYLPIDGAPGGTSPIGSASFGGSIGGSLDVLFLKLLYGASAGGTLNNFTFVPTVSALDIQNIDQVSLSKVYTGGVSPTGYPSTAFNFIAQGGGNVRHTTFTARTSEWLFNEIENVTGNNLNCSPTCQPAYDLSLTGPKIMCDEATYTVNNLQPGQTVTWSVEGPAYISASAGNEATVTRTGYGLGKVKAIISSYCGSIPLEVASVRMGVPYGINVTEIYSEDGCGGIAPDGTVLFSTSNRPYIEYNNIFKWNIGQTPAFPVEVNYYIANANGIFYQKKFTTSESNGMVIFPRMEMPEGFYNLELWLTGTECSEPMWEEGFIVVNCDANLRMVVYPNPTSNELKIGYQNLEQAKSVSKAGKIEGQRDFSAKLYDRKGKVLREGKTGSNKEVTFQVSDLPNGTYFVHIKDGAQTSMKQVIIQH
ncbi:T9SS type A sorting domain-containing protein [Pedobacter sp. R-06]|uniref:T9SS type A sorting domain-containing protein n=1 Tax=Pedobacter sp. R-06 TaxID=3404051 RepID=UPI003CF82C22